MMQQERFHTAEEFWAIARLPENQDKRPELDDGAIIDRGSSSRLNTVIGMRVGSLLNAYVIPRDLGFVTGADGGFKLAEGRVRRPDTAFISAKHRVKLVGVEFTIAPDLAVEVVSPDEDIFRKAREYLHAGTRLVWAIYAEERTVYVMTLNANNAILSLPFADGDTLDGGDVLPGFTLPVQDIFPRQEAS